MMVRKGFSGAAVAVLACGSAAWAADSQAVQANSAKDLSLSPAPVMLDDSTPTSDTPLMYELKKTSIGQTLANYNISITGFGEAGYFYSTNAPRLNEQPTLIAFPGLFSNRGLLDQVDGTIQKTIDKTKSFDFGFQIEAGYGTDDSFIHSNGILDNRPPKNPQNQLDLVQANVSVLLPVGSGLTLTGGKFITLLGNETISPLGNQLYTHSYLFTYGIPFTQTGVLGAYTFGKAINGNDLTVTAGFTRGWNQSSRDNNGAIDFLGQVSANITDKLSALINVSEGPQDFHNNSDYRTVVEAIIGYQATDQLKLTGDLLYGDDPHHSAVTAGRSAQWYAAAVYAGYKISPMFTLNGRVEAYRDNDGFTVAGIAANYYEATVGVDIHPLPNNDIFQYLQFRPEVRYDYSDKPAFNAAHEGGRGDNSEFTCAIDAIMQF
jgi:hypothetical protein